MKYFMVMLVLLLSTGCSSIQRDYYENWEREPVLSAEQRYYWLRIADLYMELTPTQARQRLDKIGDEEKTTLQWYRYALLNQQLNDRAGWVRARDAFRYVLATESLSQELYGLTKLLLKYNQNMINWDARYSKVKIELKESEAMQQVLEEKIQAITNLEQSMSTRKEQTVDP
jgi:hypothetical protein